MSFFSFEFVVLVIVSVLAYYWLPKKIRWIALLLASYAFYWLGGGSTIAYLLVTTASTYVAGRLLTKWKRREKNEKACSGGTCCYTKHWYVIFL